MGVSKNLEPSCRPEDSNALIKLKGYPQKGPPMYTNNQMLQIGLFWDPGECLDSCDRVLWGGGGGKELSKQLGCLQDPIGHQETTNKLW